MDEIPLPAVGVLPDTHRPSDVEIDRSALKCVVWLLAIETSKLTRSLFGRQSHSTREPYIGTAASAPYCVSTSFFWAFCRRSFESKHLEARIRRVSPGS